MCKEQRRNCIVEMKSTGGKKNDLWRSFSWLISRYAFWILALLPYVNENEMHLFPSHLSFYFSFFFKMMEMSKLCKWGASLRLSHLLVETQFLWNLGTIYICMYVCMYVCMYICMYMYILHNKGLKFGKVPACAGMIKPHHVINDR